jgi:AraC-like DNA-binding protein
VIEGKTTDLSNFVVIESLESINIEDFCFHRNHRKKHSSVTRTLFQQYIELLSQSSNLRNHVAHYAELLNTTPQNLNAICRKEVNQTAAQVLSTHLINEAKRQLIYTDNRVSEIAFHLDFVDASHFVKYFKRHTGFTPMVFRSQPF